MNMTILYIFLANSSLYITDIVGLFISSKGKERRLSGPII